MTEIASATIDQLEDEITSWHVTNYPKDDVLSALLGVVEELGELNRVELKQEGNIRGTYEYWQEEKVKEVGDVLISLINFCGKMEISFSEIERFSQPDIVPPIVYLTSKEALLWASASIGRLIEFNFMKDAGRVLSAIVMIVQDMKCYCELSGLDFWECIFGRWTTIAQRDFIKNPETGGREREEKIFDPTKTLLEMIADRTSSWEAVDSDPPLPSNCGCGCGGYHNQPWQPPAGIVIEDVKIGHDGHTCNCDPEFRKERRISPGVCVVEPCLYEDFHIEGQTHNQFHGW